MDKTCFPGKCFFSTGKDFIIQPVRHRYLEQRFRYVFERFGFREITSFPIDFNNKSIDRNASKRLYEFAESHENRILLRSDPTTSIAGIVATCFNNIEKPVRVYYIVNSIIQYPYKEFCYAGAEIIGSGKNDADFEMMIMAMEALQEIGISDFHIDIGHVAFWDIVFKKAGLNEREFNYGKELLRNKSFIAFIDFMKSKSIPAEFENLIINAPFLRGKKDLLNSLKNLNCKEVDFLIDELKNMTLLLEEYGMEEHYSFDLSILGSLRYYSGYVFEIYVKEPGIILCTGGRYDNLMEEFGYSCPATGFSINLDYVMQLVEKTLKSFEIPDFFIIKTENSLTTLFKVAKELRRKGFLVEVEITDRTPEESIFYARHRNIKSVIVLGSNKKIILKNLETDDETIIDFEEFLL